MSVTRIEDGIAVTRSDAEDAAIYGAPTPPAPPPPRTVPGTALVAVLTDEQAAAVKPRDLLRIAGRDAVPITKGAVGRIAAKLGTTPAALFDAADA